MTRNLEVAIRVRADLERAVGEMRQLERGLDRSGRSAERAGRLARSYGRSLEAASQQVGVGLSPRVRGNLQIRVRRLLVSGSIPAGAGEPAAATKSFVNQTDKKVTSVSPLDMPRVRWIRPAHMFQILTNSIHASLSIGCRFTVMAERIVAGTDRAATASPAPRCFAAVNPETGCIHCTISAVIGSAHSSGGLGRS